MLSPNTDRETLAGNCNRACQNSLITGKSVANIAHPLGLDYRVKALQLSIGVWNFTDGIWIDD